MIRVNLLPPEARRKASATVQLNLPWQRIGSVILALVALSSAGLIIATQIQTSRVSRLSAQWEKVKAERGRVEKTEAALRAFQNRAAVFKETKAPAAQWAPRLNILSDAIVAKLWFTSLEFKPIDASAEGEGTKGKKRVKVRNRDRDKGSGDEKSADKKSDEKKGKKSKEKAKKGGKEEKGKDKESKKGRGHASKRSKEAASEVTATPIVLKGSFLVSSSEVESPVNRYIHRVKQHPDFSVHFKEIKLKTVEHRQVDKEEVSDFIIELFPKGQ